ncbi:alpha/beta fold hydrolase [Sneathiella chinensis]|uniref:Palmitoyl-protein thioesterase ABHD10, mitochondrial n=1 Tax=Sneathiella chinensis TaxID=349750 RepID=A0ABQ5U119_9PROT|nr:alpha/beta hydrolase [Sneathiella chinensis]GLQ05375.1 alpha/beta hydrolase [Sneathiella chinensis]
MTLPNSPSTDPEMLPRPDGQSVAYHHTAGSTPGVIFCSGFMSDMEGTKATILEQALTGLGRSYTRFDYLGHGQSTGHFEDGTISRWTDDALAVLDECTAGPQIVVGSSMGGWIGLRMALLRPDRVKGFIGIAAAPDFTARMKEDMPPEGLKDIEEKGFWAQPSEYSDEPYVITRKLLEDGPRNFVMTGPLGITCPVHLLQGMKDDSVPWETALRIQDALQGEDVVTTLIKNGDHRLSEADDLNRLIMATERLCMKVEATL